MGLPPERSFLGNLFCIPGIDPLLLPFRYLGLNPRDPRIPDRYTPRKPAVAFKPPKPWTGECDSEILQILKRHKPDWRGGVAHLFILRDMVQHEFILSNAPHISTKINQAVAVTRFSPICTTLSGGGMTIAIRRAAHKSRAFRFSSR
jgi:hypothetical protein